MDCHHRVVRGEIGARLPCCRGGTGGEDGLLAPWLRRCDRFGELLVQVGGTFARGSSGVLGFTVEGKLSCFFGEIRAQEAP